MKILVTGGAGFIGTHVARHFGDLGAEVRLLDNFSRLGSENNCEWLKSELPNLTVIRDDIRDSGAVRTAVAGMDVVIHLAAQVAVTTSVNDPRTDFEINAGGTLNVLEAARLSHENPIVIYASTNKVYGDFTEAVTEDETRYRFENAVNGIDENKPLDFHSPYGCSKGAGDQYVRDYARIYGLPTVVFRQSCIYGERQFGVEDQGWLAHFAICAVTGRPITIYGDGKQVRDVLYVGDLNRAFELAIEKIDTARGEVYNIGGGPEFTLSIWEETAPILEKLSGKTMTADKKEWRPGDQRIYVSDISKAKTDLEWYPKVTPAQGLERLYRWVQENRSLFDVAGPVAGPQPISLR